MEAVVEAAIIDAMIKLSGPAFLTVLFALLMAGCGGGGGGADAPVGPSPDPVVVAPEPEAPEVSLQPAVAAAYYPANVGDAWVYQTFCFCLNPLQEIVRITGPVTTAGKPALAMTMSWPQYPDRPATAYIERTAESFNVLSGWMPHLPDERFAGTLMRFGVPFDPLIFGPVDSELPESDWDEDGINDTIHYRFFTKVAGYETMTVPAGTFTNVLRLEHEVEITMQTSKLPARTVVETYATEWRAPGIGLIGQSRKAPQFPYYVSDTERSTQLVGASVQGVTVGDISGAGETIAP